MKKSIGAKTLLYPTPVLIVGTYDKTGKPNVMTVAWGGICCTTPPCVSISVREATYTLRQSHGTESLHDKHSLGGLREAG